MIVEVSALRTPLASKLRAPSCERSANADHAASPFWPVDAVAANDWESFAGRSKFSDCEADSNAGKGGKRVAPMVGVRTDQKRSMRKSAAIVAICLLWVAICASGGTAQESRPAPRVQRLPAIAPTVQPVTNLQPAGPLDDSQPGFAPDQPGALAAPAEEASEADQSTPSDGIGDDVVGPAPDEPGFLQRLLNLEESVKSGAAPTFPLIKLSGFFHLDQGLFSQDEASRAVLGDIRDGVGFRRARMQAIGDLTEFTGFSIEMDFAIAGRPSLMDIWVEQRELPLFDTVRIGHFRQPTSMDCWTSIRHLEFMERSAAFQAFDPFRRLGAMSYTASADENTMLAYSVFATGFTFWNGTELVYGTIGDNRYAAQETDNGGISFATRLTHLLYYDEPSDGRYLLHIGGGYDFSEIGGTGTTGLGARTYQARSIPEFFVGDIGGNFVTAAGTPVVVDTGRFLATNFQLLHAELAGNYGPAHFQTEFMWVPVQQMGGPIVNYNGGYIQGGYFLTGEHAGYNKLAGVMDYNVKPFTPFFGTGRDKRFGGWGAWELAFRWSYLDLSSTAVRAENYLPALPGPPPTPNPGILNESTVALNWYWNQYARIQFNWIHSMVNSNLYGKYDLDVFAGRFQLEF